MAGTGARILVIDDDEVALQAICDLLDRAGYTVFGLASPIGATQLIAMHGISLAVIDLNMPIMRGDRFISLVRSWDKIRDLPVVLVSGESMHTLQEAVANLSGVTVVLKSQMSKQLTGAVALALRSVTHPIVDERTPLPNLPDWRAAREPRAGTVSNDARKGLVSHAIRLRTAWQDFVKGRAFTSETLRQVLAGARSEAESLGLNNCALLLASLIELVEPADAIQRVPADLASAVDDFFHQLGDGELERVRSWDRSLKPTMLRSRVERARHSP